MFESTWTGVTSWTTPVAAAALERPPEAGPCAKPIVVTVTSGLLGVGVIAPRMATAVPRVHGAPSTVMPMAPGAPTVPPTPTTGAPDAVEKGIVMLTKLQLEV